MSQETVPPEQQLTPEQIALREKVASGQREGVGGPGDAWAHSPALARAVGRLGGFFRSDASSVNQRLTELAILVTARARTAQIEWYAHAPRARRAGIGRDVVSAIAERQRPQFDKPDETVVYQFAVELNAEGEVSDQTFASAVEILGSQAVVDLTALVGFYNLVAMTLKTYQLHPPAGASRLLSE